MTCVVGATIGFSVKVAERVTPPPETEMVTSRLRGHRRGIDKELRRSCCPPESGRSLKPLHTAGLLLLTWKIWSVAEGVAVLTVANDPADPLTDAGLRVIEAGWPCGVIVSGD